CLESLCFFARQNLIHRLRDTRDLGIPGDPGKLFPWSGFDGLDVGSQPQVDFIKTRLFGTAEQIALVEVEHRVAVRRLKTLVIGTELPSNLPNRGRITTGEDVVPFGKPEAIDWLEDRKTPFRTQHAPELPERLLLVWDVDENGAGRHHVHRGVREIG